jgi:allantoinase
MPVERVLSSRRVVLPDGVRPAAIHIRDGRIERVTDQFDRTGLDFGDLVIMPGLVDTHVHINEPGRTDWEGFTTTTKAAAAGGITTLVEMPLNAVPATTTVDALEQKIAAAAGQCWVDVGFWGGVVPGNQDDLVPLLEAGCRGFKCFLTPSGVPEFEHVQEADLRQAMAILARAGAVLLAHAELPSELQPPAGDPRSHAGWLASRPRRAEDAAIELLIRLGREYGCRVHIVHLVSSDALRQLAAAESVTVETCPHYLTFAAEDVPDGATEYKCAPPLREGSNRDALWEGLRRGTIGMVVTDHSPSPPALKKQDTGDFVSAWGGIASLQLSLPAVWTEASRRGCGLEDIARWMCATPAALAGLDHRKGRIAPGFDADLAIWDPNAEFEVDAARLHHRHKLTPYAGRRLQGVVHETWLAGTRVDIDAPARGRILRRERGLAVLNAASKETAETTFRRCCGSSSWSARMASERPYASAAAVAAAADRAWRECGREDCLEAFAAHPRIGEQTSSRWSQQEQAAAAHADAHVLDSLAGLNRRYAEKFGYIYIVCATGKTAAEMLAILERRIQNDPAAELLEAAEQQRLITHLRLEKLLQE